MNLARVGAWFCDAHLVPTDVWDQAKRGDSIITICGVVGERGTRWAELSKESAPAVCKRCTAATKKGGHKIREVEHWDST